MYVVAAIYDKISSKGYIYGIYNQKVNAEAAAKSYNDSDLCTIYKDPRTVIKTDNVYALRYDPNDDPNYEGDYYDEYHGMYATLQDAQIACGACKIIEHKIRDCDCADYIDPDDDPDWWKEFETV